MWVHVCILVHLGERIYPPVGVCLRPGFIRAEKATSKAESKMSLVEWILTCGLVKPTFGLMELVWGFSPLPAFF